MLLHREDSQTTWVFEIGVRSQEISFVVNSRLDDDRNLSDKILNMKKQVVCPTESETRENEQTFKVTILKQKVIFIAVF